MYRGDRNVQRIEFRFFRETAASDKFGSKILCFLIHGQLLDASQCVKTPLRRFCTPFAASVTTSSEV
ncbi:MAG: hypothetical protein ABSE73_15395 [Planctomycetota bacterium]